jgi:Protein of unknown function (DUF429)
MSSASISQVLRGPAKPITCLSCTLQADVLSANALHELESFAQFEAVLAKPGLWIASIDFPFGQSRTFIESIGWPITWAGYSNYAWSLGKDKFCKALDNFRASRPKGQKEYLRATDRRAKSISPQKLYGVPVGKMFFQGAPRLIQAGVTIPYMQSGDPSRIVVEAYPKLLARRFIPKRPYKSDDPKKQTAAQHAARCDLLKHILGHELAGYGFRVVAAASLAEDPSGDHLDALLCAIQAAWAWTQRENRFGAPDMVDALEGWIADPACR